MYSVKFPEMFNGRTTELVADHDAIVQDLRLLLLSSRMESVVDPYYGTRIKLFLFEKGDYLLEDLIIDDIFSAIKNYMPAIVVKREDITLSIEGRNVYCSVKGVYMLNYQIDVSKIKLTEFEEGK